jgi:hypothetical protein
MMPRRSIIAVVALTVLRVTQSPSAQPPGSSPARDLVGTWTLSSMERLGISLRFSPVQVQGQDDEARAIVTLKRLSGEADMLPR